MSYMTTAEIKDRIPSYDKDDFFDSDGETKFDDLLVQLEKESRELIESFMGDVTFDAETDKVTEKIAPDDKAISLPYPITDISKVEYKLYFGDDWNTLDSGRYTHTDHKLILQSYPRIFRGRYYNQTLSGSGLGIKKFSNRITWGDFCSKLKITYDRGFSTIPENVKNIQASLIKKMLRNIRMEQNISALKPDQYETIINANRIMTDDIRQRLKDITSFSHKVVTI